MPPSSAPASFLTRVLGPRCALFVVLGSPGCGGAAVTGTPDSSDGGTRPCTPSLTLSVPTSHRAVAAACELTRGPGFNEPGDIDAGAGVCTSDVQCTEGTNPRCTPRGRTTAHSCDSDVCFTDADCGSGKLCECGAHDAATASRDPHTCIPADCRTDTDCGPGGYCSPSFATTCGAFGGVVGYFCHRIANQCKDECTNDSDCKASGNGPPGYCAWDAPTSKWTCSYSFCSG